MSNVPVFSNYVTGYRAWMVRPEDKTLLSLNEKAWPSRIPYRATCATCDTSLKLNEYEHIRIPQEKCSCGIYAYHSLSRVLKFATPNNFLLGEVALWGKVVQHQLGFRAEFAYPTKFYDFDAGDNATLLMMTAARAYGCEIVNTEIEAKRTARELNASGFKFYLTGSRFFGGWRAYSDWDYFVQDSEDVRVWLLQQGFMPHPIPTKSQQERYRDLSLVQVFEKGRVQIQCVKSARDKLIVQELLLKYSPRSFLLQNQLDSRMWNIALRAYYAGKEVKEP